MFPHDSNYSVSLIIQKIKEPVGRKAVKYLRLNAPHWIPKITRMRGTRVERAFWQSGGGYDRNIDEPQTMQSMVTYIHENPVRRGLVARACDWKWSSAGWFHDESPNSLEPDPIPAEWLDLMDFR